MPELKILDYQNWLSRSGGEVYTMDIPGYIKDLKSLNQEILDINQELAALPIGGINYDDLAKEINAWSEAIYHAHNYICEAANRIMELDMSFYDLLNQKGSSVDAITSFSMSDIKVENTIGASISGFTGIKAKNQLTLDDFVGSNGTLRSAYLSEFTLILADKYQAAVDASMGGMQLTFKEYLREFAEMGTGKGLTTKSGQKFLAEVMDILKTDHDPYLKGILQYGQTGIAPLTEADILYKVVTSLSAMITLTKDPSKSGKWLMETYPLKTGNVAPHLKMLQALQAAMQDGSLQRDLAALTEPDIEPLCCRRGDVVFYLTKEETKAVMRMFDKKDFTDEEFRLLFSLSNKETFFKAFPELESNDAFFEYLTGIKAKNPDGMKNETYEFYKSLTLLEGSIEYSADTTAYILYLFQTNRTQTLPYAAYDYDQIRQSLLVKNFSEFEVEMIELSLKAFENGTTVGELTAQENQKQREQINAMMEMWKVKALGSHLAKTSSDMPKKVGSDITEEDYKFKVDEKKLDTFVEKTKWGEKGGSNPPKTNFEAESPMFGDDWNNYFRETYGYDNVNWETAFKSPNDIIDMPSTVTRMKPQALSEYLSNNGWYVESMGKGRNAGILFSEGGGFSARTYAQNGNPSSYYIQYSPGSSHHGGVPYYKVSSGNGIYRYYIGGQ